MITRENFSKIIQKIEKYNQFIDTAGEYVNIDKVDQLFIPGEIQDMFFKELFTEEQVDLINEYLYEYDDFLCNVNEDISTAEELYDYIIQAS